MTQHKKISERNITLKDNMTGYDKKIKSKTFVLPNGIIENFFIDNDGDSCQVLALTEDNDVLLVEQFRPGVEKAQLELPGGGVEKDEQILEEAAARELKEETGYEGEIEHVGSQHYSPYSTGMKHMFVAHGCRKVSGLDLDPNEFLTVKRTSLEDFKKLLNKCQIRGTDTAFLALNKLGLL